ncbi:MAG: MazG family protein [Pseudolysinimonas sp.]
MGTPGPAAAHPRLDELIATLERLRAPGGCAWDRDQTHASLVQYLIEETYELVEAIESGTREELIEELGDVLYQVLFHADIEAEAGSFTLEDVAEHMTRKMVGRHPHIFGDTVAETPDAVAAQWQRNKQVEKAHRTSVLEGIPQAMPALALADKMLGRAENVGVTPDAAPAPADEAALGAQLLSIVAGAREAGLDSERALRAALRALGADVATAEAAAAATAAAGADSAASAVSAASAGDSAAENV